MPDDEKVKELKRFCTTDFTSCVHDEGDMNTKAQKYLMDDDQFKELIGKPDVTLPDLLDNDNFRDFFAVLNCWTKRYLCC